MSSEQRTNNENLSKKPHLKHDKVKNEQLVLRIQNGEYVADNMLRLWQQNQGMIGKIAARYSGYAEIEDLKQEGYLALCEAVRHYDAQRGVPFINYAVFWIKQGMQRYIENCGGVVRIPTHAKQAIIKYKRIKNEYRKYYGSEPSDREMRAFLGVNAGKLEEIKKSVGMGQIRSLSEPLGEEDYTLEDSIASSEDMDEDVIKELDTAVMSRELWESVGRLSENQSEVIRQRYLGGMTLREIGEKNDINIESVRQLQSKAMRTLRIPSRSLKLKAYYEEYIAAASIHHIGLQAFNRTWTSEVERDALGY